MDMNETARIIPEIKPIAVSTRETRPAEEDAKLFFSSLTAAHNKEKDKPLNTTEDVNEPVTESLEEPSASEETNNQEPRKPLRFLPGVLVGWGGELPPLPDVGVKPSTTADDTQKTPPAPIIIEVAAGNTKSPTAAAPRERFVIKKKEAKPVKAELELSSPTDTSAANNSTGKDAAAATQSAPISLKDKPPDVSTEAFLASLSRAPSTNETSSSASANKGDAGLLSQTEKGTSEGDPLSQTKSQAASAPTNSSKPPLSGILKKSSAYPSVNEDKRTALQKDQASQPPPLSPKPVPVLSSTRNEPVTLFHQGYLQVSQAKNKPERENQTVPSVPSEADDPGTSQAGAIVTQTLSSSTVQGPQEAGSTEASKLQHDPPALPVYNNAAPIPLQQQQPQLPGSYNDPTCPQTQDQNHSTLGTQDSASHALPGLQSQFAEGQTEPSGPLPSLAKDYKRVEERYKDPWERPRSTEERDHHGRHSHHRDSHHGKKSRHNDREREKKHDRSHDRSHDDKYRDRSRHHGHSDDRYGEKRKERHHSDDYSSRHKDRHRHRRDSDYENGRRSSKDSYS